MVSTAPRVLFVLLLLALACTPSSSGEPGDEQSKEEKIRALLALLSPVSEAKDQLQHDLRRARGVSVGMAAKLEELTDLDELVEIAVPIYEKHLDEGAVDALLAFHRTREGARVASAMPHVTAELAVAIRAWAKRTYRRALDAYHAEQAAKTPPRPGVRVGTEVLDRTRVPLAPTPGVVSEIRHGDFVPGGGLEIGFVGPHGAVLIDAASRTRLLEEVAFEPSLRDPAIVEIDGPGTYAVVERGGSHSALQAFARTRGERNWKALDLLDARGRIRWSYGGDIPAVALDYGELGGTSGLAFVVGFQDGGGVHLVDRQGDSVWKVPGESVESVALVDLEGTGLPSIVHTDEGGRLVLRSTSGEVLRRLTLPEPVSRFTTCRWPTATDPERLLLWSRPGMVRLLDAEGRPAAAFALPTGELALTAQATPVVLRADAPAALALLIQYGNDPVDPLGRRGPFGALHLFARDGTLLYHEVLPETGRGLAAVPSIASGGEQLLVAGGSTVWCYEAGGAYGLPPAREPPRTRPGAERASPVLPRAMRVWAELQRAGEGLDPRLLVLDIGRWRCEARLRFASAEDVATFGRRLEESPYVRARARDPEKPVLLADPHRQAGGWDAAVDLRFGREAGEEGRCAPSRELSREFVEGGAEKVGLRVVYASAERVITDMDAPDVVRVQSFEFAVPEPPGGALRLAHADALVTAYEAAGTSIVTGLSWSREEPTAEHSLPEDAIGGLRIELAVWAPRR